MLINEDFQINPFEEAQKDTERDWVQEQRQERQDDYERHSE